MKSGGLRCIWAAWALLLMAPAVMAATTLRKVQVTAASSDSARVVLDLSAMPERNVFTIEKSADKPDRVVIDLTATRLAPGLRLPQAIGPVLSVRSGTQSGKPLRLVIELSRKLEPQVSVAGSRLTIDIGAAARPAAAAVPAATAAPLPPPPPAPVRAAHAPEDTGRDIIVAVDAGHGGTDPGALGARGTREKDVTLAMARALARRIDAEPGYRAYLVRNEDRKIPLAERRDRATREQADIFVSIHADSIRDRSVAGSSVYVLSEKGASSEAARLLAEQENAVDQNGDDDQEDLLNSVLKRISLKANISKSVEVAERALSHLDRVGTIRKTQVQRAGFAVLKVPDIPSILVETAYISNPGEEMKLRDPAHQVAVAEAIFNGVREHFRSSPPGGTLVARQKAGTAVSPIMAGSAGP
jgi:N-acetylmuramoyl-L-alanine amidase